MAQETGRQYLVFRISGSYFAIQIDSIERVLPFGEILRVPLSKEYFEGVIRYDDKALPLFNLGKAMGLSSEINSGEGYVVVLNPRGNKVGILIDSICNVCRVNPENINDYDGDFPGVDTQMNWEGNDVCFPDPEKLVFSANN